MYYIKGHGWFVVRDSARKHGVADGDILHVLVHAVLSLMAMEEGPGVTLHLGADAAGRLTEVITVRDTDEVTRVIHAMPMRRKYVSYLTEDRRHDR